MSDPEFSNPWTTLGSRAIYDNPWINVREDQIIRPDGLRGIYGVVHFKHRAVGVLPVDDQGRIWMIGQYRYPLNRYSWEIPEGGGLDGESPEATAARELQEETGLTAGHLDFLTISHLSNSVCDEVAHIFRATQLTQGPSLPEGTEKLQVRLVTWKVAWQMLKTGEITDSMTQIALLHEALRRSRGPL